MKMAGESGAGMGGGVPQPEPAPASEIPVAGALPGVEGIHANLRPLRAAMRDGEGEAELVGAERGACAGGVRLRIASEDPPRQIFVISDDFEALRLPTRNRACVWNREMNLT